MVELLLLPSIVLRDKNGNPVFETTKTYGNGKIKITGFKIKNLTIPSAGGSGTAALSLFYERLRGNLKGKELTKDFRLKLSTEPNGSIINCHLDEEGPPCYTVDLDFSATSGGRTLVGCGGASNNPGKSFNSLWLWGRR